MKDKRPVPASDVEVWFCDPRSPWRRGSRENTNRLLRQYLPQGADLFLHRQARASAIASDQLSPPRLRDVPVLHVDQA